MTIYLVRQVLKPVPHAVMLILRRTFIHFSDVMSLLKKVSQAKIRQVQELSARIFGESYNPDQVRNGAEVLAAPLKGSTIASYYGDNDSAPTFKDFKKWFPELKLIDPKEQYRLLMVALRKKRNKGPPKKKSS